MSQLVNLYIGTFSDAPYFELFSQQEVISDLEHYLQHYFYVALIEGIPVGMLCAEINHDFGSFNKTISKFVNIKEDIYLSELIVDKRYRRRGIGKSLILSFYQDVKDHKIYLRTAKNNNDHIITMYKAFNFSVIPDVVQSVQNTRINGTIDFDDRVFMINQSYPHHT